MSLRGRIGGGSKSTLSTSSFPTLPPVPPKQPLIKQRPNHSNIPQPSTQPTTKSLNTQSTSGSGTGKSFGNSSGHEVNTQSSQQQQQHSINTNNTNNTNNNAHQQHYDDIPMRTSSRSIDDGPRTSSLSIRTPTVGQTSGQNSTQTTTTPHFSLQNGPLIQTTSNSTPCYQPFSPSSMQQYAIPSQQPSLSSPTAPYSLIPIPVQRGRNTTSTNPNDTTSSPFSPMSIDPGVKVVLRIRPFNRTELDDMASHGNNNNNAMFTNNSNFFSQSGPNHTQTEVFSDLSRHHVIASTASTSSVSNNANGMNSGTLTRFNFDLVLSPQHTQRDTFDNVALPMLNACLQGYNSTIFCYGQSGSGKSHTMDCSVRKTTQSSIDSPLLDQEGIIPRSLRYIYRQLAQYETMGGPVKKFQWQTYCSLLEVYNDKVYDLLDPQGNGGKAISTQDIEKQADLIAIKSFGESQQLLSLGLKNRKVASTLLNAQSSRSHLIFILYLSTNHISSDGSTVIHNSKLALVDLAGSERIKKSGVLNEHLGGNSEQLDEATHINKSLSCLSNVINKINSNNETKGSNFVPYRDSALTRILRDSLGGNALTCVIACISPSRVQEQETLSTLRFAESVRKVKNRIALNEIKRGDNNLSIESATSRAELERLVNLTQVQYQQQLAGFQQQEQLLGILNAVIQHKIKLEDVVRGVQEIGQNLLLTQDDDDTNSTNLDDDGDVGEEAQNKWSKINTIDKFSHFLRTFDFSHSLIPSSESHSVLSHSLAVFNNPAQEPLASYPIPQDPVRLNAQIKALIGQLCDEAENSSLLSSSDPSQTSSSSQQPLSAFALEFKLKQIQQEYSNLQELYSILLKTKKSLTNELTTTIEELAGANEDIASKLTLITSLESNITRLNNDLEITIIRHQEELEKKQHEHEGLVEEMENNQKDEIATLERQYSNKIALLNAEHQSELTLRLTQHQTTIEQLNECQRDLKLEQDHTLELIGHLKEEEMNREKVEKEYEDFQLFFERTKGDYENTIKSLHSTIENEKENTRDENQKYLQEVERAEHAEGVIQQHLIRIEKLTKKLQQVVTERDAMKEKCSSLEDKYTVYLQKCAQKIQNLKAEHESTLGSLQDMHSKYTTELQNEHQSQLAEKEQLVATLSEQLNRETTLSASLQNQLRDEQKMRNELQGVYNALQEKFSKQSTSLSFYEKESQSRGEQISQLESQLATRTNEYETLFQINLSLSSHNNDNQKIKMQEILRERLRVAETKLRETQLAYDQLHQKHYVQSQRSRLQNGHVASTTPTATAASTTTTTTTTTLTTPTAIQPPPQFQQQATVQTSSIPLTITQPSTITQSTTPTAVTSTNPSSLSSHSIMANMNNQVVEEEENEPLPLSSSSSSLPSLPPPSQQYEDMVLPSSSSSLQQQNPTNPGISLSAVPSPTAIQTTSSSSSSSGFTSNLPIPTVLQRSALGGVGSNTVLPQRSLKHKQLQLQQQQAKR